MPGVPPGRVGYLGPRGTFCEAALRTLPVAARGEPYVSVADALDAVRRGDVDAALVPFENSVEGSVSSTLDELATGEPLHVTTEVLLPVTFDVLVRPGTSLAGVKRVATHPHAEAQCRAWLRATLPDAVVHPASSTAEAAVDVANGLYDAAVASPLAGEAYGLVAAAHDVGASNAVTRFVLVTRPAPPAPPTGTDRTTLVAFIADDHPGALLELLTEFAVRGVNLTRIESRPTGAGLGRYCFSIDCDGHVRDARVGEALSALKRICADVRFLGSYPRAGDAASAPRRGTGDGDFRDAAAWLDAVRDGRA
ncbi:MAG TPA: prephenate dehydratase [Frankiaceae bacterium]|jgi:prephenate dehydratase|nr:prephenate dehydratase [Frankiaceae bacterium]